MDNSEALAFAGLWSSVNTLRFMVNRGLISPNEVDEAFSSIAEALESGDPAFAALVQSRLQQPFAEMRDWADKLWIGKGQSNPR